MVGNCSYWLPCDYLILILLPLNFYGDPLAHVRYFQAMNIIIIYIIIIINNNKAHETFSVDCTQPFVRNRSGRYLIALSHYIPYTLSTEIKPVSINYFIIVLLLLYSQYDESCRR